MNRRKFLQSLAVLVAASNVSPSFVASTPRKAACCRVNPEWLDAPYECVFFVEHLAKPIREVTPVIFRRTPNQPGPRVAIFDREGRLHREAYPHRFDAEMNPVFPFVDA